MDKKFDFIDLFAGIGGFRYALESNGGNCVFSSEWDEHCKKSYELNFFDKPYGDITKIKEEDIPKHDILCAGFPCQSFSIAGNQKGFDDTRGTLFFDIARIVKYHKPKVIFLENVKNLNSHNGGVTFKIISNTLEELGYKVFNRVLNAKDFGLPQNRERIAIICIREDINIGTFSFPRRKEKVITISDIKETDEKTKKYIINRDDIRIDEIKLRKAIAGGKVNRPLQIGKIAKGGQGNRIYHENGIGVTLAASSGGAAPKTGAYYINGVVRKLSPREAARLQGFPEEFIIIDNDSQALKQFGNSVPINLLQAIMEELNRIIDWAK